MRQVKYLYRAYKTQRARGLVSKYRAKPCNHQFDPATIQHVMDLIFEHYRDFGPTLAHEELTEVHGLQQSDESVQQLMITKGIWKPKKAKQPATHPLRERRACFGELVQIGGSEHAWFEDWGPKCSFLVYIAHFHLAGFSPRIAQETSTETVLIGLVAAGLGVTLVPGSLSGLRTNEVAYRPLADPVPTLEVYLIWKEGRQLSLLTALRQIAQEVSKQMTMYENQ